MAAAMGSEWVKANMHEVPGVNSGTGEYSQYIFNDYGEHYLQFFYMERGGSASNCMIKFNLPTIPKNSLIVGKELEAGSNVSSGLVDFVAGRLDYTFEVLKVDGEDVVTNESMFDLSDKDNLPTYQIMENGQQVGIGTVKENGTFTLKAGQLAVFSNLLDANAGHYVVRETLPANRSGQYLGAEYDVVGNGGTTSEETNKGGTVGAFTTYTTNTLTAANKTTVLYKNQVNVGALSLLNVTKVVQPGSNIEADTEFEIEIKVDGVKLPTGTKYLIGDTKHTLTAKDEGIIRIKAGETIRLGILQGSTVAVRELDPRSQYHITYSGKITHAGSDPTDMTVSNDAISGKVDETNSTVDVTVSNADYAFEAHLTLSKQLAGAASTDDKTFTFNIQKLDSNLADDGAPYPVTLSTHGSKPFTKPIYFGFQSNAAVGDYYYRISEVIPDDKDGISYDESSYIVKVKVTETEEGVKSASITSVTKYASQTETAGGTKQANDKALAFVNSKSGSLSLKKIAKKDGAPLNGDFTFRIKVGSISGTYSLYEVGSTDEKPIGTVTFTGGSITAVDGNTTSELTIASGKTLKIAGLPAGQTATITETSAAGFAVSWEGSLVNAASTAGSTTIQTTAISATDPVHVICTNTTGAALPSTGGIGTHLYTFLGITTMLGAGMLLLNQRRRKEGPDAV